MREEEIEKTIIDPEKPRTTMPYNPNEGWKTKSIGDFFGW
jgi:hypothetical protein